MLLSLSTAAKAVSWEFFESKVPHLNDCTTEGSLFLDVPLCSTVTPNGEALWRIAFSHKIEQDQNGRTLSRIYAHGLKTSLAPFGPDEFVWSHLNGEEYIIDLPMQRTGRFPNPYVLCWPLRSAVFLTFASGWRLYFVDGYLVRAITPEGSLLRITGHGPLIETITTGSLFSPAHVLDIKYTDAVSPSVIRYAQTSYQLEYSRDGTLDAIKTTPAGQVTQFKYENGLLSQLLENGVTSPVKWRRIGPAEMSMHMLNGSGWILTDFAENHYEISCTQGESVLTARNARSVETLVRNNYTGELHYEKSK